MQGRSDAESLQQEISDISRSLKALAKELNVPVVALSQLSRAVEARKPPIPMLADLRESGAIEQDADVVIFIYREDVYDQNSERKGIADILVSKHRNGPIGKKELFFHGWKRVVLCGAAGVSFSAFILAQSRGALGALVIAALYITWSRFEKKAVVALALIIVALALMPNPLSRRLSEVSKQDPYAYSRVDIWKSSLERIAEHPWGTGLGMFKYASFQYRFPNDQSIVRYGKRAESAHSGFLQIAVELGIAGLGIFLFGIWVWICEVKTVVKNQLPDWEHAQYYKLGEEIVTWSEPGDFLEKVLFYSRNERAAARIREAGQQRALRDHTC